MLTHQEADWTPLEIGNALFFAREARGKLGVQNEAAQFFLIVHINIANSKTLTHRNPSRDQHQL